MSSAHSYSADGVLEINQTCAAGDGCFPDDDPGFPVRIAASGSYVLTSNLVVPAEVDAITTAQPGPVFPARISINLDLNGFTISSTTTCVGDPLMCSPKNLATGFGIVFASNLGNFHLRNGTIRGMAGWGVTCASSCVVSDLIVSENGYDGVYVEGSARDVIAQRNGRHGIRTGEKSTVERCVSRENGQIGFQGGGTYTSNFAENNTTAGFGGTAGAVLIGNRVVSAPGASGISCDGCNAQFNSMDGGTYGINFSGTAGLYGGNVISGATSAAVFDADSAVQSSTNLCNESACP